MRIQVAGIRRSWSANGVPNTGGFATDGVICEAVQVRVRPRLSLALRSSARRLENKEGVWTVSPAGCQAASTLGGTSWSSTPLCTYGEADGEGIIIELAVISRLQGLR